MTYNKGSYQWAVVGAGPAGIAAVGKLLDLGVLPNNILWIDPAFKVGDFGQLWRNVSSNTKVKYFNKFLHAISSFTYDQASNDFSLTQLDPEDTCTLSHAVDPLQWITDQLIQKVVTERTLIQTMFLADRLWTLCAADKTFKANNVILANGSLPLNLDYPGAEVIPFEIAIDKEKLANAINTGGTYAVFGSSHSAIIILRYLVDLGVKKVINFYRSPCRYALPIDDWILFDNTGLKGQTAAWARENIDGALPPNLVRYNVNKHNTDLYLSECDKVIYAVGFKKRKNIVITDYEDTQHNPNVGIIGPGLFGLGIAYPEDHSDPFGSVESQVGLWKFMVYLNKVMPVWLKYTT